MVFVRPEWNRDKHWLGKACLALGAFLFLSLATGRTAAQDEAGAGVPVDVYWQHVEEALEIIEGLDEGDDDAIRTALDSLTTEFSGISAVVLVDGQQMPLDNGYLISMFQEVEPDLNRLEAYLKAVLTSRSRWPDPSHDAADLAPLATILARPEFQSVPEEPGLFQRIWRQIIDSLLDFLVRLFPESAGELGPLVRLILTIIGFIALVAVLFFTLRGFLAGLVAEADSAKSGDGSQEIISADQALEQAHAFSKSGDYRSAVRYLYLSSLLLLEERGVLRYDRTQTNQEYLRSIAGKPELAAVLRDVIDVFDRVWYGFQSLDDQDFSHYAGRVEELKQQR